MLQHQHRMLLKIMCENEYVTAVELSEYLGIGVKTVRVRLKELNQKLQPYGVEVISKPRRGYLISPRDEAIRLLDERSGEQAIPSNSQERFEYLLAYLLNRKEYVKAEELCDFLFISKGTLTNTLRQVESVYEKYHLTLEKKPNYGMKLQGREFDIRQCMVDIFFTQEKGTSGQWYRMDEMSTLEKILRKKCAEYQIAMSESSFYDFVCYIYVVTRRVKTGCQIEDVEKLSFREKEEVFLQDLAETMEEKYEMELSEAEKNYFRLQIAAKYLEEDLGDEVYKPLVNLEELIEQILVVINEEFQIDLSGDWEMRSTLKRYLKAFELRMKYGMMIRNFSKKEIRQNYAFSYEIASRAALILQKKFAKPVNEDEISYLALIFELALEQKERERKKYSVLIVCSSGKTSSKLLEYRYKKEFFDYIDQIYTSDLYTLVNFDFSKVDYIFTTVPIEMHVPVPVVKIESFLNDQDIQNVKHILAKGDRDVLAKYFHADRFFTDIKGENREEVLRDLAEHMQIVCSESEELYESIMRREVLAPTDFGNLVAIPHPDRIFTEETHVAVAVLEKPVIWAKEKVQVVILTAIGSDDDNDIQQFYEALAEFVLRREDVETLIENKNFETLMRLLKK